jgi:GT2 family glycosyltransferase
VTARASTSVVIAAHSDDRWADIVSATESAKAQVPPPTELILVVDHNPGLACRARRELEGAVVVENTGPRGASSARNIGVQNSSGAITVFLDDDQAAIAPTWLRSLCDHFADTGVVGVGGGITPRWDSERPRWFPREFDWVIGCSYAGLPESLSPIRNVWGGNTAILRETFDAVGGFRTGFGKVGHVSRPEDTDLCLRVQRAYPSGRWLYDPSAVVSHHVPDERCSRRYFLTRCWFEGRGKAELLRLVGGSGMSAEGAYATRVLPRAALRELLSAFVHADVGGLERCVAIISGFAATSAGWLTEIMTGRFRHLTTKGPEREPGE